MRNASFLALVAIISLAALSGCCSTKKKECATTGSCCPSGMSK